MKTIITECDLCHGMLAHNEENKNIKLSIQTEAHRRYNGLSCDNYHDIDAEFDFDACPDCYAMAKKKDWESWAKSVLAEAIGKGICADDE